MQFFERESSLRDQLARFSEASINQIYSVGISLEPEEYIVKSALEQDDSRARGGLNSGKSNAPLIGSIGVSSDVLQKAALHDMYAQIIEASADAIYSYDLGGCILTWNSGAEKLYGYAASEIIGHDIAKFIPLERAHELSTILTSIKNGEPLVDLETERLKKDGSRVAVQLTISPLRNQQNQVTALAVIARDITERALAEELMRQSEQLFHVSFEISPVSKSQVLAATGRFVLVNKKMCELTGYSAEELYELTPSDITFAEDRARDATDFATVLSGETDAYDIEKRYVRKDGSIIWVYANAILLRDEKGRPDRTLAEIQDITERKHAEIKLRDSEARFRGAVAAVEGIIWTNNAVGEMIGEQPGWSALTGQTLAEYQGLGWSQAVHPDDAQPTIEAWNAAVAAKSFFEFEHRVRRQDGEWRQFSIRAAPIFDREDKIVEWVGVHMDITERRRSETRLRESELRLAAAMRAGELGVHDHDLITGQIIWDETLRRIWGVSADEPITPQTFDEGVHPDDLPGVEAALAAAFDPSGRGHYRSDYRVVGRDGITRWVQADGDVTFEDLVPVRLVGTARDISELKRTEQALRESEEFSRAVLEASPDCLKVIDADGRLNFVNHNGACLFELDDGNDIMGQAWESMWPEISKPLIRQSIEAAKAGQLINFTAEAPTAKGTPKHWEVSIARVPSRDGEPIRLLATSRDVTEKIRIANTLRESEMRFRSTFENAAVGVAHVALDGTWLAVNAQLCSIVGYSREELLSHTFQDITHPDDLDSSATLMRLLLKGDLNSGTIDKRYIRKNGSIVWIALTASMQRREDGEPDHFIAIIVDISAQKEAEAHRDLLMRELAHRSKNQLAVVQAMASQTARNAPSMEEFSNVFASRIQGLAISSDILIAERWDGAPLGELVTRQLQPFGTENSRLMCEGPDVYLTSDAAQTIGLALHELATNCVKYGAWSHPSGLVRVSWTLDREGAQPLQLRVNWTEQGGPPVSPPTRKGFGHMVIERMTAQKLGGAVEMTFAPQGLSWTLAVPATHLSSPL